MQRLPSKDKAGAKQMGPERFFFFLSVVLFRSQTFRHERKNGGTKEKKKKKKKQIWCSQPDVYFCKVSKGKKIEFILGSPWVG